MSPEVRIVGDDDSYVGVGPGEHSGDVTELIVHNSKYGVTTSVFLYEEDVVRLMIELNMRLEQYRSGGKLPC